MKLFKMSADDQVSVSRAQMRHSKHRQNLALSLSVLAVAASWMQVYSGPADETERSAEVHYFKAKSLGSDLRVNKTPSSDDKKSRDPGL